MSAPRVAVAVMAKVPAPGAVKTRLCPPLEPAQAAALARCFLADRVEQLARVAGAERLVAFTPPEERAALEALLPAEVRLVPQVGPDLSARLERLVADLLAEGHAGAIAMDADSPTLPTAYIERACAVLRSGEAEVVVGPADDGGYYLIGLARPLPALFQDMPWSTPAVCEETLRRARRAGRRVVVLPRWFDVDRGPDLARLRVTAPPAFAPPRTLRYLAALGPLGGAPAAAP